MKKTTHHLGKFDVVVGELGLTIQTKRGVFRFGVDNEGRPYISAENGRLLIIPSASNRINIFEER